MTQKKKTLVGPSNREAECYFELETEFLITFAKLRKVTASFIMSVPPSVRTEQLGYQKDFQEFDIHLTVHR